jgi:hypothetical protein
MTMLAMLPFLVLLAGLWEEERGVREIREDAEEGKTGKLQCLLLDLYPQLFGASTRPCGPRSGAGRVSRVMNVFEGACPGLYLITLISSRRRRNARRIR